MTPLRLARTLAITLAALGPGCGAAPTARPATVGHSAAPDTIPLSPEGQQLETRANAAAQQLDYRTAVALRERQVEVSTHDFGPESRPVAVALHNLAVLWLDQNDHPRAEQLFQRSLAITAKVSGPDSLDAAQTLGELGKLYTDIGDSQRAFDALSRSMTIRSSKLGWQDPVTASSAILLGQYFLEEQNPHPARVMFESAKRIYEKLSPTNLSFITALAGLARCAFMEGDLAATEEIDTRVVKLREDTEGPMHPEVGSALLDLGEVMRERGEYANAEATLGRALAILRNGPNARLANVLESAGVLYIEWRRQYPFAEKLLLQALALRQQIFGPTSRYVASVLDNLAHLYWVQGDLGRAVSTLQRASEMSEHNITNASEAMEMGPIGNGSSTLTPFASKRTGRSICKPRRPWTPRPAAWRC